MVMQKRIVNVGSLSIRLVLVALPSQGLGWLFLLFYNIYIPSQTWLFIGFAGDLVIIILFSITHYVCLIDYY